jgi:DNA repair exonuclease SbcCD ATPase subunit
LCATALAPAATVVHAVSMNQDIPVRSPEDRRAAIHRERAEAIDGLRLQIETLVAREPELRKEIAELERSERATIAELEKTQRTTLAELEKTQRATIAELQQAMRTKPEDIGELEEQLEQKRSELDEELDRTRTELDEELTRTRTELADELARLRAELAAIPRAVINARCTLGMKMSDFALEEHDGHQEAIEYLEPLLTELRSAYTRALSGAKQEATAAEEELKSLQGEHHPSADAVLTVVERRFEPMIHAEIAGVTIQQARVRVARHQLALLESVAHEPSGPDPDGADSEGADPDAADPHLARELELEAALGELDTARAKVSALQEEKKAAIYHYSHPTAERGKHLGGELAKRFGRHR